MIALSRQQQAAIDHMNSPVLVAAGAGSGKTRTLIAKFVKLIQSGFDPKRILAITLTNKAANEMQSRLITTTGIQKNCLPWVKTYHSACFEILRENCELIGLKKPIQVYSSYYQQKLIKELLIKLNFNKKHHISVLNKISNAKNTGRPEEYLNSKYKFFPVPLLEIYKLYEQELALRNAVDFNNILLLTRDLLRDNNEVRTFYRTFFQYILCDEYQDTNNLNEEITKLLIDRENFFAVGDDWQSIYSFRMSNIDHFLFFKEQHPNAKIFRLEENYRSANEIVQMGNRLINFNKNKMKKICFSKKKGGVVQFCEFDNDYDEAKWIVEKLKLNHAKGIPYEKIAILYRTKFCSLPFEKSLRKNNIPYKVMGGKGFFERMEIMDLNCYMAAAIFEKDDISFARIINIPRRGIGPGTLKKISNLQSKNISLKQAAKKAMSEKILPSKIYTSIRNLLKLLSEIKKMRPSEAIRKVIDDIGYMDYLEKVTKSNSAELTSRIENIEQIIYSSSSKNTIEEYIEETSLIREHEEQEAENEKSDRDSVNLSTIHRVKGLEFKTVFVTGCEEQLLPHWRSISSDKGIEEERRLMYVALTRAEKYLFITSASFRKGQYGIRSRFLNELQNSS